MKLNRHHNIRHIAYFVTLSAFAVSTASTAMAQNDSAFSRARLLSRFDENSNGKLDDGEAKRAISTYGFEIPVLPDSPHNYQLTDKAKKLFRDHQRQPKNNPLTDSGAALGRVLFYDRRLSKNNSIACASCHHQSIGFSDPNRFSVGWQGGKTKRTAMRLSNLTFTSFRGRHPGFFWDERAPTLEQQSLMPIQDSVEMGMKLKELELKLAKLDYYPNLFEQAFGDSKVTSTRIGKAMAQFMRAMISCNSRFDQELARAKYDINRPFAGFSKEENLGKSLFVDGVDGVGEQGCAHCHLPPTFGMAKAFNNGLDLLYKDKGLGARKAPNNDPFTPSNDGKFRSPSLRNVALSKHFMHDGRFSRLEQVLDHYSEGVKLHANLGLAVDESDEVKKPTGFGLSNVQKKAIIAFLKTLTDNQYIRDKRFSDPFIRIKD